MSVHIQSYNDLSITADDGGKCISMHEQRVGQLCSLGSRSEMHRPQQRECGGGLMCHLIDDKVWPSGICLHEGVQLTQNIMLGKIGLIIQIVYHYCFQVTLV